MRLELSHAVVRSWKLSDVESLVRHANNRKIWRNLRDAFPHPYTTQDARRWIRSAAKAIPETNFAIAVDDEAIGGIGIALREDVFRRSAEIGYWLGEAYWGRGFATEALKAMTEYAFANFDLSRLYAGVFEWNTASMRVLEKAGYEFEARLRRSVLKDGQLIDELVYALVRV
jgi:RimJ/RimL family protein N-acetyltransferase